MRSSVGRRNNAAPRCTAEAPQIRSRAETSRVEVPECRSKNALAYPIAGMLALIAQAMFSGVCHAPQDRADYAATLSRGQLRALGLRRERHTGRSRCPGVTPFRDVLAAADARGSIGLKRGYWVIESRLHHALDNSLDEDTTGCASPTRRRCWGYSGVWWSVVANAWLDAVQTQRTRWSVGRFMKRFAHRVGGPQRLRNLILAKAPPSWRLLR
jgi:hypothetical protein